MSDKNKKSSTKLLGVLKKVERANSREEQREEARVEVEEDEDSDNPVILPILNRSSSRRKKATEEVSGNLTQN